MRSALEQPVRGRASQRSGRVATLEALADVIAERALEIEERAVRSLGFARSVVRADIEVAIQRLRAIRDLLPVLGARLPVGTVALCLPGNAVLSNPVAAIATSYLAGNHTLVRMPRRRGPWAAVVEQLMRPVLGHAVEFSRLDGATFIRCAMDDGSVGTVMVFGDDRWASRYEHAARRTGTRFVFEGPGKDPFLVLPDAPVAAAARGAVASGLFNAGQACTAPERFYVHADRYDEFVESVLELASGVVAGDPRDDATQVGPLSDRRAAHVMAQVQDAVRAGAEVLCGGTARHLAHGGQDSVLVAPTVLVGVDHTMAIMRAETFGPVIPIQRIECVEEALALAEDSPYGLAATTYGAQPWVRDRLSHTHGAVFLDETWLEQRRRLPLGRYGGRRLSGWVWEWRGDAFIRRDGPRLNLHEFSRHPRTSTPLHQGADHA
jgi:acyl-CoA reductase-like NAD-dependent aldehyde dehydrogenase